MGMRIDKTRQDNPPREIDLFCTARLSRAFDAATRSYCHDAIVMYQKSAISDNPHLAKRTAAPGYSSAKG